MTVLLAACAGSMLLLGGFVMVLGIQRRPQLSTGPSTGMWKGARRRHLALSATDRRLWAIASAAGVAALVVTRIPLAVVAVPAAVVGLTKLLRTPDNPDVLTLEALDRWVRLVASSMPTGKSVADAIRATVRQSPPRLQIPLRDLVTRLDDRFTTREALLAFADQLASADADPVVAALILASERGGRGAVRTLAELSETTQERLRALREVEAEREKPRIVVRQVTAITIGVLALVAVFEPGYFTPLASPLGQVITFAVLVLYLAALYLMRQRTRPRTRQRLLTHRGGA